MYVCVLGSDGEKYVHRRLRNDPEVFRKVVSRYGHSLTVVVESTSAWYWLADLCEEMGVTFVLGHAQYMKWIHGAKAKNDRIDSEKLARMTLGGNLPYSYTYPRQLRSLRDLLRRRSHYVSLRTGVMSHLKTLNAQANMPALGSATRDSGKRAAIPARFTDPEMAMSAEADAVTADFYDSIIAQIERHVLSRAKEHRTRDLALLMTAPGVGKILALTIILEINDIERFPSRQDFSSYARLINCAHTSNGKIVGSAGHKIGNPYLRWALGEVGTCALRKNSGINALRQRYQKNHDEGQALSMLAHKFGRAFYYMLKNGTVFDEERFLAR
jgi:transposase